MTTTLAVDLENRYKAERLLSSEALLADTHQYDAWLDLWHPEALYRVPCNDDAADPQKAIFLLYERLPQMKERIRRLAGKRAHAQSPKSRLARLVSNIVISQQDGDEFHVNSSFVVGEWRAGTQTTWYGRSTHILIAGPEQWRIKQKDVYLINNDGILGNLQFLI